MGLPMVYPPMAIFNHFHREIELENDNRRDNPLEFGAPAWIKAFLTSSSAPSSFVTNALVVRSTNLPVGPGQK